MSHESNPALSVPLVWNVNCIISRLKCTIKVLTFQKVDFLIYVLLGHELEYVCPIDLGLVIMLEGTLRRRCAYVLEININSKYHIH